MSARPRPHRRQHDGRRRHRDRQLRPDHGGSIRTPGSLVVTYDPTRPNNFGINLENYGVDPDVWAENTPEDELKGFDRELQAAVDEVLSMLKEGKWQYEGAPK